MRKPFKNSHAACGLALVASLAGPHSASAVDVVSPMPEQVRLAVTQAGSLSVSWRVRDDAPEPREVFSQRGEFVLGGVVVATVSQRLSRRIPDGGSTSLSFGETLRVPQSLIVQAAKRGIPLGYRRAFTDSYSLIAAEAAIRLEPAGSSGADLTLSRIELDFGEADPARYVTIDAGQDLRPRARIRYGGSGVLEARWLLADPASTKGEALFQTRQVVRQLLPGSANQIDIEGPALPSERPGVYELRFQVEDAEVEDSPRLLYHVR